MAKSERTNEEKLRFIVLNDIFLGGPCRFFPPKKCPFLFQAYSRGFLNYISLGWVDELVGRYGKCSHAVIDDNEIVCNRQAGDFSKVGDSFSWNFMNKITTTHCWASSDNKNMRDKKLIIEQQNSCNIEHSLSVTTFFAVVHLELNSLADV